MKVEAQLCFQCGAMDWSIISSDYVGSYRVRRDGHIVFRETFEKIEYVCNKCGATSPLMGVKGTTAVYSQLANLKPMQRILKALECIADGTLKIVDADIGPDEVKEYIECFGQHLLMKRKGSRKNVEDFVSKARCIVGKWKLLE